MKRLLVASDLSARSDRALARAVELMNAHDAHLTVLHVIDDNLPRAVLDTVIAAARDELESSLARLVHRGTAAVAIRVVTGNAVSEILETAAGDSSELIVLGRHRDESRLAAFGGMTLGRVVRLGRHPVLVVADRVEGAYGTVMVGVDFSAPSRCALRTAREFAPDAWFHVVHAFDVPFLGFFPGQGTRLAVKNEHERALSRLIETEYGAVADAPESGSAAGPRVEKILCQGEVESVLRQEADRIKPDLLAIGTHGRTGVAHALLGSVAEELLDQPPCDVLAVRSTAEDCLG